MNNNENRRPRSAYDYYGQDRNSNKISSNVRPEGGRARSEESKARVPLQNGRRGINQRPVPNGDRRAAKPVQGRGTVQGRANNGRSSQIKSGRTAPNQGRSSQGRSMQGAPKQGRVNNAGSHQTRPVKKSAVNDKRASVGAPERRSRAWAYPEGNRPTPPPNVRVRRPRPQNAKPVQKKKRKPSIDFVRIGRVIFAVLLRFVLSFVAVSLVLFIIYYNMFHSSVVSNEGSVVYLFDTMEEDVYPSKFEYGANLSYSGNERMICFSDLSKWMSAAQVGDIYSMRFIVGESNVVFHYSSHNAYINSTPVIMSANARFVSGEIWVPIDFVSDYMTGLDVEYSKEKVTVSLNGEEVGFVLMPSDAVSPVEEPRE